jgi:phage protein D
MVNYRSTANLEIDGNQAPPNLMGDILQIIVEESLHRPGMFTLVLENDYLPAKQDEKAWRHQDLLQIGKSVKIGFSSSTTESPSFDKDNKTILFEGEITAIETNFSGTSQAPIIVRGYDVSHRLHRGRYSRSFLNMTDSDIVKKITKEVGIKSNQISPSGVAHDYVFQSNQTNMEFLRERANRIGFELFIQDGEINFRKPKAEAKELTLKWLVDLHSFRVKVTSAEQVQEVEVRGWDYSQKRAIVSTAKAAKVITETQNGKGSDTSNKFNGTSAAPKMIVVDKPIFNSKEAETMAQALCDELGGKFICADAKTEGNGNVRPGKVVKIEELGQHSGKYYITETRHVYQERVYITEFSVRSLRGEDFFANLNSKPKIQPGQSFLVGIVTDNEDPEGWGRVKVKYPTLTEEHTSNWARIVSIGAGTNRGIYWLPELDDEVLVAFEHGDIHRPYIIGGVWNGQDPTPQKIGETVVDGKVRLRVSKTRCGHKTWFVDEDKGGEKRGYYIQTGTGKGHSLRLNDTEKFVEIETAGGHKVRMSDSDSTVTISSTGNLKIEAKGNIEIKANGTITMNGAMIKLN